MSVREITGDIIRDAQGIICHQVNYQGVMGGGIAASIREKLLSSKQYIDYQQHCDRYGAETLGTVSYCHCKGSVIVANMFCQNEESSGNGSFTNYDCMERCFKDVRKVAETWKHPVFIPGHIGCGIAGGDWTKVKYIIHKVFQGAKVPVTIVYWEKESWNIPSNDDLPFN
ncbi:MAG: hypothetical protein IKM88_15455 [Lachnospiraceae bacterium]|nr:hypothetical protein [Lachnospiraceae bacterium]